MLRKLLIIAALLVAPVVRATLLTGTINYGSGAPVTGTLTLTASQRMNVLPTGNCGGPYTIVPQNPQVVAITGGAVPGGTDVVGNDCVAPTLTWYAAQVVDNTGVLVLAENWRITGGVVDLSNILPIIAPSSRPLNLNGDVTGDVTQSYVARLQGWPLTLTGSSSPVEGNIILFHSGSWTAGTSSGIGTVTSVALTAPAQFTVSGSPITGGGTLGLAWGNQGANLVLAGPTSGPSAAPTFRALVAADIPAIPESGVTNLTSDLAARALTATTITAGSGLTGGGDLSANRTLSIASGGVTDGMIASAPTPSNTPSTIVERDGSGNFAAGTITGTLSGNATNVSGVVDTTHGGTAGSSAAAGFNNINPMSTTGDLIIETGTNTAGRLAGITSSTKNFLTSTGTGSAATAPAWGTIAAGDVPAIPESTVTNLVSDLAARVQTSRNVNTSTGLSGGGNLTGDLTLSIVPCVGSGVGHAGGGVPDPGSSAGTSRFLREDCSFANPQIDESQVTGLSSSLAGLTPTSRNVNTTAPLGGGGSLASDLTLTVAPFVASGSSHAAGIVPDPGSVSGTTKFLREDASFAVPVIPEANVTNLVSDLAARALTSTTVGTTLPLTGGGSLSGSLSLGINVFGASGVSHSTGAVPDPGSSSGTTKFLREDSTWATPAGAGTVTSVGLAVPNIFTNTGGPITTSGTITLGLEDQPANEVWAGPATGPPGPPAFRSLVVADIPELPESQITNLTTDLGNLVPKSRLINTTAPLTGGGDLSSDLTLGVGLFGSAVSGIVNASGGDTTTFLRADNTFQTAVTSVGLTMPGEFSVASSPVTTSGTIAVTKANQNANIVYAGPATGSPAAPAFRALVANDIPTGIPEANIANLTSDLASKAPTARLINTTSPIQGGGDLTADRTLSLTTIPINLGGTNATTAIAAMANLGVGRTISTTSPLSGGGDLSADRTIALTGIVPIANGGTNAGDAPTALGNLGGVPTGRLVSTGTGLTGGGDLSANRTLALANLGTAGSCGDTTHSCGLTVDAQGRISAYTNNAISGGGGGGGTVTTVTCGAGLTCAPNPIISVGTITANSFGSAQAGIVPASGGGTTNFLRADGSWAAPASGGSFVTVGGLPQTITSGKTFTLPTVFAQTVNDFRATTSSGVSAYYAATDEIDNVLSTSIVNATNASPIVVSLGGSGMPGLSTGDTVLISGVLGNTAANGTWSVVDEGGPGPYDLVGSTGNGAYTSGGLIQIQSSQDPNFGGNGHNTTAAIQAIGGGSGLNTAGFLTKSVFGSTQFWSGLTFLPGSINTAGNGVDCNPLAASGTNCVRLPNAGAAISGRNAANTADVPLLSINASDRAVLAPITSLSAAIRTTSTFPDTMTNADYTVLADTTGGSGTVNLPASPTAGMIVNIKKIAAANTLTIGHNGHNIDGAASDLTVNSSMQSYTLQYSGTFGWAIL